MESREFLEGGGDLRLTLVARPPANDRVDAGARSLGLPQRGRGGAPERARLEGPQREVVPCRLDVIGLAPTLVRPRNDFRASIARAHGVHSRITAEACELGFDGQHPDEVRESLGLRFRKVVRDV